MKQIKKIAALDSSLCIDEERQSVSECFHLIGVFHFKSQSQPMACEVHSSWKAQIVIGECEYKYMMK